MYKKQVIDVDEMFGVGNETFVDSKSHQSHYGVVFEDDSNTGYFYAVSVNGDDLEILDALHIYNVLDIAERNRPSRIQISWTEGGLIASLLINNYCHAVFSFSEKGGYCRNGFPQRKSTWCKVDNRVLTDELIEKIFKS